MNGSSTLRMRKAIDLGLVVATVTILLSSTFHSQISWLFLNV